MNHSRAHILRFVGPVREPETRFDVAAEARCLCSLRAQERMEILIGHEALEVEESGVCPIRCQKQIGRT